MAEIPMDRIFEFSDEEIPFGGDLDAALLWFTESLVPSKQKTYEFPERCIRAGHAAMMERPMVTVGTIHSVKGGEADSVFLFPDLSASGANEYFRKGEGRDAAIRLMYVGGTRARENLFLMGAVNRQMAVDWRK